MKTKPAVVDETPCSAFVAEMKAAFLKHESATTNGARRRVEEEMREIMRKHLGPGAWESTASAATERPSTPRRRFRAGLARRASIGGGIDRKLAAAGPDED